MHTEGSPYLELPPLSEYEQSLVQFWFKIGTVKQTSNGPTNIEWQEIVSWATHFHKEVVVEMIEHPRHSKRHKRTYTPVVFERCSLLDWELEQIKNLSQEYVAEYSQNDPQRECPKLVFIEDLTEEDALVNAESMESAMDKLLG